MKLLQTLSASTIALIAFSTPYASFASVGPETGLGLLPADGAHVMMPADGTFELSRRGRGRDDAPGDDRGGDRGRGRGADDGPGDDRGGDRGRGRGTDDNSNGTPESGSGRSRPRVPGGSGCDDAGDIAEHSGCS